LIFLIFETLIIIEEDELEDNKEVEKSEKIVSHFLFYHYIFIVKK
jgi:hypothetical protein